MRISTISSSFATVVTRVIDSVVVAGIAVRIFLHQGMCERDASTCDGNWLMQSQPTLGGYPLGACLLPDASQGNLPQLLRQACIKRLLNSPSTPRLAYAAVRSHS